MNNYDPYLERLNNPQQTIKDMIAARKIPRFNRRKCIWEILGPLLEQEGFTEDEPESGYWSYSRMKDNVWQDILIYYREADIRDMLVMELKTSNGTQALHEWMPDSQVCWQFHDKESFQEIITYFRNALAEKGLAKLEEMSIPTVKDFPTIEQQRYLWEHHEELSARGKERLDISKDMEVHAVLEIVMTELTRIHDIPTGEVWDIIFEMSAVYGDILTTLQGEWQWKEMERGNGFFSSSGCTVAYDAFYGKTFRFPLIRTFFSKETLNNKYLLEEYEQTKRSYEQDLEFRSIHKKRKKPSDPL